jgi:hypothetical protein
MASKEAILVNTLILYVIAGASNMSYIKLSSFLTIYLMRDMWLFADYL